MTIKKALTCWSLYHFILAGTMNAQVTNHHMPAIVNHGGRYTLMVDGKPFFILGGQAHNSSAWPGMMGGVWSAAEQLHLNTLELPVYWEQIEPQQGNFDFSLIDTLLLQARHHNVRLVLLWFATWKNGSNHYLPGWMKQDAGKYPNIMGKNGKWVDSPSPHIQAAIDADSKAFASLMSYLQKADPVYTVIMVQVENEPGAWGSVRDYSPIAQKLFESAVPAELLKPNILTELKRPVSAKGTWQQVFGVDADEYFQAWSVAHFIGKVAAAGKSRYALPLYVNVALRDPISNPPANSYESGGATDNVIAIWKVAAPAIDLLAPDIYIAGSDKILKVLDLYTRSDNPLLVPEISLSADKTKYLYEVIARSGLGFSPFGIDAIGNDPRLIRHDEQIQSLGNEYAMVRPMVAELAKWAGEGKIKAAIEHDDQAEQTIDLGGWQAIVTFGSAGRTTKGTPNAQPVGKVMIVQLGENRFLITGTHSRISFHTAGNNAGKPWQYLDVREGQYKNGNFETTRILNGDETDWGGPYLDASPVVLQIELITR